MLLITSACSTFHGPADGSAVSATGDDEEADSVGGIGPTLSLRGEREVIRPTEPINFDWPLDEARMTRGFLLGGKAHWGVDLANKKGTNILAAEKGTVVYTGRGFHGYGNLIVIEHNDEWATLYSHLSKITIKEGQAVARGGWNAGSRLRAASGDWLQVELQDDGSLLRRRRRSRGR